MLSWEFPFTQPSDVMAIEYVKRQIPRDPAGRHAMNVVLFNLDTDTVVMHWEVKEAFPTLETVRHD
jgi:hypothetical protein